MEILGLSREVIIAIAVVGAILLASLLLMRLVFRVATGLLRIGCVLVALIVLGVLILSWVWGQ